MFWLALCTAILNVFAMFSSSPLVIASQVIAPQSASGVVLDAPEASKLLSAVAIALSNCSR